MKDVVIAFSVIFLAIFVFSWRMFSKQGRLEKKIDDLREELRDGRK